MGYLDLPGICLHHSTTLHDEENWKTSRGSAHLPDPAGIIQIYVHLQLDLQVCGKSFNIKYLVIFC